MLIVITDEAVSYTHLDVYKRQGVHSAVTITVQVISCVYQPVNP